MKEDLASLLNMRDELVSKCRNMNTLSNKKMSDKKDEIFVRQKILSDENFAHRKILSDESFVQK